MHMNQPKFFRTSDVCKAKHLLGTSSNPIQTSSSPIQTRARLSIGFKATIFTIISLLAFSTAPSLASTTDTTSNLTIDVASNLTPDKAIPGSFERLAPPNSNPNSATAPFTLEIMHVNDMHSYLEPSTLTFTTSYGRVTAQVGGVLALSQLIKTKRQSNPNLIMLSSGDQITGNAANYDLFQGESDALVLKHFKADFYTLGNHEFDHGSQGMTTYANWVKKFSPQTKLVISNVALPAHDPINPFIEKIHLKTINGRKVAFLGLTDPKKIFQSSQPVPGTKITEAVTTINELTAPLVASGKAQIIVLLTHEGVALDRLNAAKFNDVDVIIGGDSHSLCGDFKNTGLTPQCRYPMTLKNASNHQVCVVQAYEYTKLIGDLWVDFDAKGNVQKCYGHPLMLVFTASAKFKDEGKKLTSLNSTSATTASATTASAPTKTLASKILPFKTPVSTKTVAVKTSNLAVTATTSSPTSPATTSFATTPSAATAINELIDQTSELVVASIDPELEKALTPYLTKIHSLFTQKLGYVAQDLCSTRLPGESCDLKNRPAPHGSETCQVFAQAYLSELGGDLFLGNSGSVRADLAKGELTADKLLEVIPFGNKLVMVELTGTELLTLLNQAYRYILREPDSRSGSVPCGYGLLLTLDEAKALTDPITKVKVITSLTSSNQAQGSMVTESKDLPTSKTVTALEPNKVYRVLTNDYLIQGKDGYTALKHKKPYEFGLTDAQVLTNYLKRHDSLPLLKPNYLMLEQVFRP